MLNLKRIKELEISLDTLEDIVIAMLDEQKLELDFCEECGDVVLTKIKK